MCSEQRCLIQTHSFTFGKVILLWHVAPPRRTGDVVVIFLKTIGFWTRCTWSSPLLNSGTIWLIHLEIMRPFSTWLGILSYLNTFLKLTVIVHPGHLKWVVNVGIHTSPFWYVPPVANFDRCTSLHNMHPLSSDKLMRLGRGYPCCTKGRLQVSLSFAWQWHFTCLVSIHYEYGDVGISKHEYRIKWQSLCLVNANHAQRIWAWVLVRQGAVIQSVIPMICSIDPRAHGWVR